MISVLLYLFYIVKYPQTKNGFTFVKPFSFACWIINTMNDLRYLLFDMFPGPVTFFIKNIKTGV
jgi:hypothetical protein